MGKFKEVSLLVFDLIDIINAFCSGITLVVAIFAFFENQKGFAFFNGFLSVLNAVLIFV